METFYILTEAMYRSLGQAILIYLASRLVLLSFPQLTSAARYNVLYLSQTLIFLIFCLNIYSIGMEWSESAVSGTGAVLASEPAPLRFYSIRALIMSQAPLIGMIYFLGLGAQFLLLIPAVIRLQGLKQGEEIPALEWTQKLEKWCAKLNIPGKIKLVTGSKTDIPFTAGFLKPVIYFPVTAFSALTTEQAEAILLHELAHIKRNDYLFNLIQKGMEMVMFFNPISWMLGAEIRQEREFCCDDFVVDHTTDPELYARGLFILEQHRTEAHTLSLAATGSKTNTLLERIKRITDMKTYKLSLRPGIYAFLGFMAAGLSVAWITPAESEKNNKPIKAQKELVVTASDVSPLTIVANLPGRLQAENSDTIPGRDTQEVRKYFNSPEWKKHEAEMKAHAEELQKKFDSPEWKKHMADMKQHSEELKKHFESPEWKKHQEMMARHGEEMKKHFESPEWKKQMQEIEKNSEAMAKEFNSPEFKKKMKDLEAEMEKKFNSPEWKDKMKAIELNSKELEKKFNSPEWKEKMKEIELNSKELEKKFNSPEWKQKMKELELKSKELEKKFNSPEFKQKMEERAREAEKENQL